jgi:hypothetical protein
VVPDNPKTQLQGMADTIRNLDESAMDLELQTLDDRFVVLLWALKTSSNVQLVER